jgi:8-oxo-dGTP diphosphatase
MKHCPECGTKFSEQADWPRHCWNGDCGYIAWKSHSVVVVGIIEYEGGLVLGRRNIEPKKGEWALTGGYPEPGENWQEALVREIDEELGVNFWTAAPKLYDVISVPGDKVLVFASLPPIPSGTFNFVPNSEVSEVRIAHKFEELAFPSHTEIARRFFKEKEARDKLRSGLILPQV